MMRLGFVMANELTLDDVIERAAIREYDGCMTRAQAELLTARDYGCKTWQELIDRIGGDEDDTIRPMEARNTLG